MDAHKQVLRPGPPHDGFVRLAFLMNPPHPELTAEYAALYNFPDLFMDGNVANSLVERYRDLANEHLGSVEKRGISDNSVLLTVETTQSRVPIAMAARSTMWREGSPVSATYRLAWLTRQQRSVTISPSSCQWARR